MSETNGEFQRLLDAAVAFHGHLCGGQIIGVRMAMAGLREIGITDPQGEERRDLLVFVEIDRCAADAILSVTGCRPGRRTLKILDYGKMAATFVNLKTGKAVRVSTTTASRQKAEQLSAELVPTYGGKDAYCEALLRLGEEELLKMQEVFVALKPEDLPGTPLRVVACDECGETVLDMREVNRDGKTLCQPCAQQRSYYQLRTGLDQAEGKSPWR